MIDFADDTDLTRLAAGELSIDEENDVLIACEADPRHWRAVALAHIEFRQLSSVLDVEGDSLVDNGTTKVSQRDPTLSGSERRRNSLALVCAAAASLAFAVITAGMAGYWAGAQPNETTLANAADERPLVVEVTHSVPTTSEPIGAVASNPAMPELGQWRHPLINDRTRLVLRDLGLDVQEDLEIHVVDLDDGSTVALPNRHLKFVSLND